MSAIPPDHAPPPPEADEPTGAAEAIEATEAAPRFSRQPIRSFVLRQGRMSDAQKRAIEDGLPRYGIRYGNTALDYAATFGRQAPVVLEIGCGMGDTTAKIAAAQPERDFIGIEVHGPGVGNLCKLIETQGLSNLRVMQHDATEVVRDMIAADSLAGVHVFFPDPWPKKRHHKRRILQPAFVHELAARLAPGGYLHCATDWEEYAQHMLEVLSAESLLQNTAADYAPRPDYRPLTKFEARGLRLGHGVWDLVFTRKA
ncbi:MAG: tRNA (guanosine(46)-N7)-methyltransferase TrmB [Moraxellaceae bacterium]|nr:tRNA (guanosine(46)-N7)-methyltransferase TrmB [Moraxellaceae bacterium]